jgi:hypothetical protein
MSIEEQFKEIRETYREKRPIRVGLAALLLRVILLHEEEER